MFKNSQMDYGYVIELPYDENVGTRVLITIIPTTDLDFEALQNYKNNILTVELRDPNEDEIDFKFRLEAIADEIRNGYRQKT